MKRKKGICIFLIGLASKTCVLGRNVVLEPGANGVITKTQTAPYQNIRNLHITLSEKTTVIEKEAFKRFKYLIEITGNTVLTIKPCAFYGCKRLRKAEFAQCTYIGSYAFANCTSLEFFSFASDLPSFSEDTDFDENTTDCND